MGQIYSLSLDRVIKALGLKENIGRELRDDITMVIDISRFLDAPLPTTPPAGSPFVRGLTIPNPARGTDWTITVPAGVRWWFQSIAAQLVTSATALNREPDFNLFSGITGDATIKFRTPTTQAPSATEFWQWLPGATNITGGGPQNVHQVPLPPNLILGPGATLASSTGNIDPNAATGDQWSLIGFWVQELPG